MTEKLENPVKLVTNPAFWRIFLLILLVLSLIPILVIAQYNHSSADDYKYGLPVRQALQHGGDVIEVSKAIAKNVISTYFTWQGTYSAVVLFSVQPAVFGEQCYFLSTYILLAVSIWAIFSFFRSWIGRFYGRKDIADIIACCVSLLFVQMMPSPVQGLFWWNGASYYSFWNALMLIQVSQFFVMAQTQKCSVGRCLLSALLGVLLAGSNFVTALLTAEITTVFLAYFIYKRKCWKQLSIVLIVTLIGFAISVFSPGNAIRQERMTALSSFAAIMKSFLYAYEWAVAWTPLMHVAMLAFCLPFALSLQRASRSERSRIPLWLKLLILAGLFVSSFVPTTYAGIGLGGGRIQNIRFLFWVIGCFMAELLIVERICDWIRAHKLTYLYNDAIKRLNVRRSILILGAFTMVVFFAGVRQYQRAQFDCFTSVSAVTSLYLGDAQAFDSIADQRVEMLQSGVKNVELPSFTIKPYVLFFDDITQDSTNWRNEYVAKFYGIETVTLVGSSADHMQN